MVLASVLFEFLSLGLAVAVVLRRVMSYRRLRIDHVMLFCLGHAYYFSVSTLSRLLNLFPDTYWFVYRYFDGVSEQRQLAASIWSFGLLAAFLIGAHFAERTAVNDTARDAAIDTAPDAERQPVRRSRVELLFAPSVALTVGALAVFLMLTVQYRTIVLTGYRSQNAAIIQGEVGRGILSAGATATILCALFSLHIARQCRQPARRQLAWSIGAVALVIPSLTLLLAGGRLYVATASIAVLVWFTHVERPVRRTLMLGAGMVGFVMLSLLGAVRTGDVPNIETVGYYTTGEAVFTSISQGIFLSSERELFLPVRVPKYLASDLTNVIPRAVLPGKDELRLNPEEDGFYATSALGATHVFVSALINFGYVGSLAVVAAAAFGLSRLKQLVLANRNSVLSITYATCSAALTFTFFRDPFSISLVRWMLMNAVLLPFAYFGIVKVLRRDGFGARHQSLTAANTSS